jgi:hypothetical protein
MCFHGRYSEGELTAITRGRAGRIGHDVDGERAGRDLEER